MLLEEAQERSGGSLNAFRCPADHWGQKTWKENDRLMPVPRPESAQIGSWLAALEREVEAGDLPVATKRTYEWGFAQFLDWFDHQRTDQVTEALIRRWIKSLQAQGHDSFSTGFWMDCVVSYFSWAYQAGAQTENPASGIFENRWVGRRDRPIDIHPFQGSLPGDEGKLE